MRIRRVTLGLVLVGALPTLGAALPFQVPGHGQTLLNVPVRSITELRFKNVVRQAYDLSCGAAAMATLLKYYYAEDVTEQQAVAAMLELGEREKIEKDGFSLLEMKRFAEHRVKNLLPKNPLTFIGFKKNCSPSVGVLIG